MDHEIFEQETKQKRKTNTDSLVMEVLAKMLNDDIKMFDTHYVQNRVTQIVDRSIKKLNFKNEVIEKARKAFLDVLIDGMQADIFSIDDEIRDAKKALKKVTNPAVKDKEAKRKIVDKLKSLERVKAKAPKDVTEERDIECEPVCQYAAKAILSGKWLLKDEEYISGAIELDNELLITVNAMSYVNELFEQVYNSLDESYLRANEAHWGCPRTKIKMSQLDNRLKE